MTVGADLHAGIAALGLTLPDGAEARLLAYLALLAKWNRTYNLTAVRREEDMLTQHLLDSLAVIPVIEASVPAGSQDMDIADVGSGGGLPGLVLAVARPDWRIASIEANQKKAAFQQQAKIELGLSNVSIHCARVEAITQVFAAAISRAFASLADFVRTAGHLSNRLWAMKGIFPADEVTALPPGWCLAQSHELRVPGLDAQRHLLLLEKI